MNGLAAARLALKRHLDTLAPRERRGVTLAAVVLGLALVWFVAMAPALNTLRRAATGLEHADSQIQTMQRLATEARDLAGTTAVPADQAKAALQAATARLGEQGKLLLQGDRAILTLNAAAPSAVRNWLAEARSGARARPLEASLSRGPNGLSDTVVVAVGSGP